MISKSLIRELLETGLQPFPYKCENKKGYFNNEYFLNLSKTKETATNYKGYFDINKYFHIDREDCYIGIAFKNGNIREYNKGYIMLDFDLKGEKVRCNTTGEFFRDRKGKEIEINRDDFSCFNDIILKLTSLGLMEQYEIKNNGEGIHLILKVEETELKKMAVQGKIHRGNHSFVEVLTGGKFVRLCPNKDYRMNNGSEHINFKEVPTIKLDTLLELSNNNQKDRLLKKTSLKFVSEITKLDIDFSNIKQELFKTEEENLIYSFIKSQKLDYELASKLASGLGHMKLRELYLKVIPEQVRHIYDGLFLGGFNSDVTHTSFMNNLIEGLKNNRDKISIKGKYMSSEDMKKVYNLKEKKILVISPTGTGKTHSSLGVAHELGLKIIFTMPNKATVEQQAKKYGIPGVCDNKCIEKALESSNIIICTLNKLTNIPDDFDLSEYILINDEAHTSTTTCDYRAEIIYKAQKLEQRFKKVIDITATPEPLFQKDYDRKITFVKKDDKKYKALVLETENKKHSNMKLLEVLDNAKCNVLCLNNDIQFNNLYAETRDNCISWNSKTKNDNNYKELVKTNLIPKNINKVLATDIFSAGLNIENTDKWKVVIKGVCDPTTIKQLVARFRKVKSLEIVLIKNYSKHTDSTYDKDLKIKNTRFVMNEVCEKMNEGVIAGVGINFIQDKFFTYENSIFEVFNPSINRQCWKTSYSLAENNELFSLFDEDSIEIEVQELQYDDVQIEFLEELEELKELKKELRELRKEKTLKLISEKQINSMYYIDCQEYDTGMIKKYLEFRNRWELKHELGYMFTEDSKLMDVLVYKILARHNEKNFKANEKYNLAKYVYKKLNIGDEINVKDFCTEKNFNPTNFKIALLSIWEVEEIRDNKKKYFRLLSRNIKTNLSKNDVSELVKSSVIFR